MNGWPCGPIPGWVAIRKDNGNGGHYSSQLTPLGRQGRHAFSMHMNGNLSFKYMYLGMLEICYNRGQTQRVKRRNETKVEAKACVSSLQTLWIKCLTRTKMLWRKLHPGKQKQNNLIEPHLWNKNWAMQNRVNLINIVSLREMRHLNPSSILKTVYNHGSSHR